MLFRTLPAGVSATRWPVFVALGLLETATMYLVGTFCIIRLRLRHSRAAKPQPKRVFATGWPWRSG
ncbi:hypothetical protein MJ579_14575 [Klebsiella pneumoniae]|nr:hypothetical protein MJ579_14575 [Klebsiella pneumoniae]